MIYKYLFLTLSQRLVEKSTLILFRLPHPPPHMIGGQLFLRRLSDMLPSLTNQSPSASLSYLQPAAHSVSKTDVTWVNIQLYF